MAKASTAAHPPLVPSATVLRRALKKSSKRAQTLADAFGVKVPVERTSARDPRAPGTKKT